MGEYKRLALLVFIIIGVVTAISGGQPARADTEPVIVGVPRDFYPEYAIGPDDRPEGFGVDVMNAVAKRAGLSVTYRVFATWSETLAALERGDIDVIPVVVITPARESRLLFTRPFLTSSMSIFVRRDAENIQGVADLAGRRMGMIKGGPVPELFGEAERRPVLVPYGRLQDEMFGLLLGAVDAIPPFEIRPGWWPRELAWPIGSRSSANPIPRRSGRWRCGAICPACATVWMPPSELFSALRNIGASTPRGMLNRRRSGPPRE